VLPHRGAAAHITDYKINGEHCLNSNANDPNAWLRERMLPRAAPPGPEAGGERLPTGIEARGAPRRTLSPSAAAGQRSPGQGAAESAGTTGGRGVFRYPASYPKG